MKRKAHRRTHRKQKKASPNQAYRLTFFLLKFNLFSVPLYAILVSGAKLPFLIATTTFLSYSLVSATIPASMENSIISIPAADGSFAAYITWDSTGWKSMLAMAALIFATDFPRRKKLRGLVFVPLVYAANIVRIWLMFLAVHWYGTGVFPFLHTTLWSFGLIATILAFWVIWMKKF